MWPFTLIYTWFVGLCVLKISQSFDISSNFQVKNFVLFGDIHKSIYFLSWKEQGSQLTLLAKDFGSLDCFATEFLIDGSTLSLVVSDSDKNVQVILLLYSSVLLAYVQCSFFTIIHLLVIY